MIVPAADPVDGFEWSTADGTPTTLVAVVDADPTRRAGVLRRHVDALDQLMVAAAREHGQLLGGGRSVTADDLDVLRRLHRSIDRLVAAYGDALTAAGTAADIVGAQVVGAAVLLGHAARRPLGLVAPRPLQGRFDDPPIGVVSGRARFERAGEEGWRGGHWVVVTEDDRRLPASLTTLLYDSSGVDRDEVQDTHRAALQAATAALDEVGDDPDRCAVAAGAIDHLLLDWLLAHRYDDGDLAVRVDGGRIDDAWMIVDAAVASVVVRRRLDPLG